ncbi:MAG: hypothetical protein HY928_05390 [Elusimicrobia bacterium]|nr:hypothetical protein [Elusimicrobiota bacterium]
MKADAAQVWTKAWDAYLETLGLTVEGSLTSPEFLRLQRRTLDMLCGHRDLWLKAMMETAPQGGGRKRARRR